MHLQFGHIKFLAPLPGKYPLAKDVWKLSDLGDLSEVVDSFRDWWKLVVQRQNMEELNMIAMLLWRL